MQGNRKWNYFGLFIHKNYQTHKIKVIINVIGYPGNISEQDNSISCLPVNRKWNYFEEDEEVDKDEEDEEDEKDEDEEDGKDEEDEKDDKMTTI